MDDEIKEESEIEQIMDSLCKNTITLCDIGENDNSEVVFNKLLKKMVNNDAGMASLYNSISKLLTHADSLTEISNILGNPDNSDARQYLNDAPLNINDMFTVGNNVIEALGENDPLNMIMNSMAIPSNHWDEIDLQNKDYVPVKQVCNEEDQDMLDEIKHMRTGCCIVTEEMIEAKYKEETESDYREFWVNIMSNIETLTDPFHIGSLTITMEKYGYLPSKIHLYNIHDTFQYLHSVMCIMFKGGYIIKSKEIYLNIILNKINSQDSTEEEKEELLIGLAKVYNQVLQDGLPSGGCTIC